MLHDNEEFSFHVTAINKLTDQISQILLKPTSFPSLSYQAGQYVNVLHQDQAVSPLSIACAPNPESTLEFHLFHPPKNLLAQDLMRIAQQEKIWRLTGPYGRCTIERIHTDKPIIFLARGTGFAPVKAVIEALMKVPLYPPMTLYWSAAQSSYLYLTDLLEKWKTVVPDFAYFPVCLDAHAATPAGLLETVLKNHPDIAKYQIYASGSQAFVYNLFAELHYHGVEMEYFYSDVL